MKWQTILFTPGNRADRVAKAWAGSSASVVVMDLEDAVPPEEKDAARDEAVRLLAEEHSGTTARAVRVNPLDSDAGKNDIAALLAAIPDIIVVPKAEDPKSLEDLAVQIEQQGGATQILAIIETARGVLACADIAAVPGVHAIAFGAEDLAADANMRRTPTNGEVAVPRSLIALGAAAAGKPAVDMICADYKDTDRTLREAIEARTLGYSGKMCLHPAQVDAVAQAFAPSADERAWAQRVVDAAEKAGNSQGGVVVVDGRMIDVPLIRQARNILEN